MKRLLCIVGSMDMGGAETFLMKIYRALDKSKYQMDFAVADDGAYDEEIRSLGGNIYHITPKVKGVLKNFNDIKRLVKTHGYEYVLRTSQSSLSALELFAAKLGGARIRVYRSSNSNACAGAIHNAVHKICRFMPRYFANVRIAPSKEAAHFMFGDGCLSNGKACVLHNGLDCDKFKFSLEARTELRKRLGIENQFVVGHVGRLNYQKNHKFLLRVFKEIKRLKHDSKLLLVGVGELENEIKEMASAMGLAKDVIFLGKRNDVDKLLSAFDVMVFPSLFEGMPNTIIEAQSASLPSVVSNSISPDVKITDFVSFCDLNHSPKLWAEKALEISGKFRSSTLDEFVKNGYTLDYVTNKFVELVFV